MRRPLSRPAIEGLLICARHGGAPHPMKHPRSTSFVNNARPFIQATQ